MELVRGYGRNFLHIAAGSGDLGLCKILVNQYDYDIQMYDNHGLLPLHHLAINGSYELFNNFAEIGLDTHLRTKDGQNCLHIAARYEHLNLCKALIEKHDFDAQLVAKRGWTALHFSAEGGHYEVFKFFVDKGISSHLVSDDGVNCLHIAALYGNLNLCKMLIDMHDFDVQVTLEKGWNALHLSARGGHYEIFKFFIDKGISSQLLTNDGSNCLHIAAKQRHVNFCKLLINKYGFDTHVTDKNGCAAFHFAARFGYYEIFKLFIDQGIDPHLKINNGMNCLHLAAMYRNSTFCKTLIENHNMDVQVTDRRRYTMLHYFGEIGSNEFFDLLIYMQANIHISTKMEETVFTLQH